MEINFYNYLIVNEIVVFLLIVDDNIIYKKEKYHHIIIIHLKELMIPKRQFIFLKSNDRI